MALAFTEHMHAARTAWVSELVIGFIAIAAIVQFAEWEEWLNLLLGVWLIFAPWIVGFSGVVAAMRTHVALGVRRPVLSLGAVDGASREARLMPDRNDSD